MENCSEVHTRDPFCLEQVCVRRFELTLEIKQSGGALRSYTPKISLPEVDGNHCRGTAHAG